jgi:hypothetical protein
MESWWSALSSAWDAVLAQVTAGTPVPDPMWLLAAIAVGALLAVMGPRAVRRVDTVAHEAGHALAAVITRRHVLSVRIHRDGSGMTHHYGRLDGLGATLTAFAGYPFPGVLGAALIAASVSGNARLWGAVAAVGLVLLLVRTGNLHGWFVMSALLAVLCLALWYVPGEAFALLLAGAGAQLVTGSVGSLVAERGHRRRGSTATDVARLAAGGRLPAGLWWLAMLAVIAGSGWLAWEYVATAIVVG